ncbi:Tetratricopeptide repeat-containing protein [Carboxydocella thermautotrophica]|nr:Tetratricopeptide repeat-containing protein [Carboxydocella thermautotrophica]
MVIEYFYLQAGEKELIGNVVIDERFPLPVVQEDLAYMFNNDKGIPWAYFIKGMVYVLAEEIDPENHQKYWEFLQNYDPNLAEKLVAEGAKAAEKGAKDWALRYWQVAARLDGNQPELLYNYGMYFLEEAARANENSKREEMLEKAEEYLEKAICIKGDWALPWYRLGFVYRHLGDWAEAKEAWQKARELGVPVEVEAEIEQLINDIDRIELVESQFKSGRASLAQGKLKQAALLLQPLVKKYPDWWEAKYYLGLTYRYLEEYDKAIAVLSETVKQAPWFISAYNELAMCLFVQGELEKAADYLWLAIAKQPKDAGLWTNLGLVYQKRGQLDDAAKCFYKALEFNPKDAFALNYLAELPEEYRRPC